MIFWRRGQIDDRPPVCAADVVFDEARSILRVRGAAAVRNSKGTSEYARYIRRQHRFVETFLTDLEQQHRLATLKVHGNTPVNGLITEAENISDLMDALESIQGIIAKRIDLIEGKISGFPYG